MDLEGRPVAYYSLACHDPKHCDISEIMRMMTYQVGRDYDALSTIALPG
jgi:hypothetical protein